MQFALGLEIEERKIFARSLNGYVRYGIGSIMLSLVNALYPYLTFYFKRKNRFGLK